MNQDNATILIVDDEEFIVHALVQIVKGSVGKILTASNGVEALAIIKSEKIHCIISDIKMPEMDGIALLKEVRSMGNEVPFVYITAFATIPDLFSASKFGVIDFIFKSNLDNVKKVILFNLKKGFNLIEDEELEETEAEVTDFNDRWGELKKKLKKG